MSETAVEEPVLQRIRLDALETWFEDQVRDVDYDGVKFAGEWDQSIFRRTLNQCGTRFCLAGKAADWTGTWVTPDTEIWLIADDRDAAAEREERTTPDGENVLCVTAWERASTVLGLTESEASALFMGLNDVSDVRHAFQLIRGGDLRRKCPTCTRLVTEPAGERDLCEDDFHTPTR